MKQTMLGFFVPSLKDGSLRNMEIKIDTYREADREEEVHGADFTSWYYC